MIISEQILIMEDLYIGMENLHKRRHFLGIKRPINVDYKVIGGSCVQGAASGCWVNPWIKV
jgi:hypothetical protein